ncbi:hypothetical protein KKC97_08570 [bacterium]|nr:hypothetical protein [bacterium]
MMKRRFVWIGLVACICLLAGQLTLSATGVKAKVDPAQGNQLEKVVPTPTIESPATTAAKTASGTLKDSGARTLKTKKVDAGQLASVSDAPSKGPRPVASKAEAFGSKDATVLGNQMTFEYADLGNMAPRHENTLDDACDLLYFTGGSVRYFSAWFQYGITEIATYYDALDCPTNPGYNFRIDSVEVGFLANATAVGTLTFKLKIMCPASGIDPCSSPGNVLCESEIQTLTTAANTYYFPMVPIECCVGQQFFVSVELLTWDGPVATCPSPFWDVENYRVLCEQEFYWDPDWINHEDLFSGTSADTGYAYIDVFGNSSDEVCTVIPCETITGACCDIETGTCVDDVEESECTGLNEYFYPNETCATLDPPCAACDPAPANDFCTGAIGLTLGTQYCGTAACDLLECVDDFPGVWHSFVVTECSDVTVDYCGSGGSPNAYLNIMDDCPCTGTPNYYLYDSYGDCGDGNYYVTWIDLLPGTYYVAVPPDMFPNYCITVSAIPCTPCEPEGFLTIDCDPPVTVQGTTVGEDADCGDGIPTYVYEVTVTEAAMYNFSLCNTAVSWDSYIWISNECCGDAICVSDDDCGVTYGLSAIECCALEVGTYYLMISGWGETDFGDYTLDISCCVCEVICTNNEGETICADDYVDTYNGGCNSIPPVYQAYTCGSEICGHSGNFYDSVEELDSRDTDWYLLSLATEQYVTWKVVTEFTGLIYILTPGPTGYECDSLGAVAGGETTPCDTATIAACLPAGDYWLFVSTAAFTGTACGTPYYFYTTCGECPVCVPDYSIQVDCEGYTGGGNTEFAGDDCEFAGTTQDGTTHVDEIWEIEILEAAEYRFSLCNTTPSWDTYMFLTTECCGGTYLDSYENADDGCGVSAGPSRTACVALDPGIVYLMVEGWQTSDSGAYTLEIECCEPCIFSCTDTEGEGDCYDGYDDVYNAGCNMWPITPVASQNFNNQGPWPQSVCGSSGTHLDSEDNPVRDTDWYEFTLLDTALVTYSGISEFNMTILIVQDTSASQACSSLVIDSDVADPCSLASLQVCLRPGRYFAWVSVSSGLDAPCGSQYEVTLDIEYDGCVLLPPAPEVCPEEYTQFAQLFNGSSAGTSELSLGYKRYENYEGCVEPICDVHWWGIEQFVTSDWEPCHEIFMDFIITFHADSSGYPEGVPVCTYNRTVSGAPTTRLFNGDPVYYYETILNIGEEECCVLENGWVSIQGASDPDCWFLWHTSIDGDFRSTFADANGWDDDYPNDLAVCLTAAPPPCDPAEELTVYLTAGLGNPILRWFAPIAEDWNVYRSTEPNNNGDITDPSYVYQATVTGSGDLEWTDPAPFAGGDAYVNYIVVPSCYEPEIPE